MRIWLFNNYTLDMTIVCLADLPLYSNGCLLSVFTFFPCFLFQVHILVSRHIASEKSTNLDIMQYMLLLVFKCHEGWEHENLTALFFAD